MRPRRVAYMRRNTRPVGGQYGLHQIFSVQFMKLRASVVCIGPTYTRVGRRFQRKRKGRVWRLAVRRVEPSRGAGGQRKARGCWWRNASAWCGVAPMSHHPRKPAVLGRPAASWFQPGRAHGGRGRSGEAVHIRVARQVSFRSTGQSEASSTAFPGSHNAHSFTRRQRDVGDAVVLRMRVDQRAQPGKPRHVVDAVAGVPQCLQPG